MPTRDDEVDRYLDRLQHPLLDDVRRVRTAILELGLTERVKWNAPSFCADGVDRVTFRLAPRDVFQVVLHRGVATRDDTATFTFDDPSGLVRWATRDRGVVDLTAPGAVDEHLLTLLDLIAGWVRA